MTARPRHPCRPAPLRWTASWCRHAMPSSWPACCPAFSSLRFRAGAFQRNSLSLPMGLSRSGGVAAASWSAPAGSVAMQYSLGGRFVPCAGSAMLAVLSAYGPAIRAVHHEAAAYGGPGFINATVHVHGVQGRAPAVIGMLHDMQAFGRVRGEVIRDTVLGLQDDREATANRFASGAMCGALGGSGGQGHVQVVSQCRV